MAVQFFRKKQHFVHFTDGQRTLQTSTNAHSLKRKMQQIISDINMLYTYRVIDQLVRPFFRMVFFHFNNLRSERPKNVTGPLIFVIIYWEFYWKIMFKTWISDFKICSLLSFHVLLVVVADHPACTVLAVSHGYNCFINIFFFLTFVLRMCVQCNHKGYKRMRVGNRFTPTTERRRDDYRGQRNFT